MPLDVIGETVVIYTHIPKSAGTSIKTHFGFGDVACHRTMRQLYDRWHLNPEPVAFTYYKPDDEGDRLQKEERMRILRALAQRAQAAGYQSLYSAAFKVAFVRNPWDRAGSLYHYHRKDFGWNDFAHFIKEMKNRRGVFDAAGDSVLRLTQSEYIKINGQFDLNFLGKYETLGEDIIRLQKILDVTPRPLETFKRRSANFGNYVELYEDFELVYTVFEYFHEDLVNFGYTFNNTRSCAMTRECIRRYKAVSVPLAHKHAAAGDNR